MQRVNNQTNIWKCMPLANLPSTHMDRSKRACSGGNRNSVLRHTNIPDEDYKNMTEGWDNAYFGSLIEFFEE